MRAQTGRVAAEGKPARRGSDRLPKSWHPGGANFVFGDGSVKFVKTTIHPRTYNNLGTANGGEIISADAF